ncbi:MAG TPA: SCP2 sterol-binding domain-containing protein [Methylophilaceae bacterium]
MTRLLNHLVNQNGWAREQLQPFGGRTVRLSMPPLRADLVVLEDGGLAMAGEAAEPDASITVPPSVALRLLANDDAAAALATLEGDTELAAALAKVLRGMSWEYEEDLSRLIGDVPAHKLAEFGRKAGQELRSQSLNLLQMLVEYWQEEQPMLAKKRHVESFNRDVDALREDAERLEKRMEKLSARISSVRD